MKCSCGGKKFIEIQRGGRGPIIKRCLQCDAHIFPPEQQGQVRVDINKEFPEEVLKEAYKLEKRLDIL